MQPNQSLKLKGFWRCMNGRGVSGQGRTPVLMRCVREIVKIAISNTPLPFPTDFLKHIFNENDQSNNFREILEKTLINFRNDLVILGYFCKISRKFQNTYVV